MARYTGPVNKKMRFLRLEIAKKSGKNSIAWMIRINPIQGRIRDKFLFLFLWPKVISKYAKIDPANNSQPLVGKI